MAPGDGRDAGAQASYRNLQAGLPDAPLASPRTMTAHQRRLSAVLCGLSASPSAAAAPPEEYRASNFVDFSEDLAAPGPTAER